MKNTPKAIKSTLAGLALIAAFASTPVLAETTVDQQAIALIAPFFTDPQYQVTKSFHALCCEIIPLLEQSADAALRALACSLRKVCSAKGVGAIAMELAKHKGTLERYFGGTTLQLVALKDRLNIALKK